MRKLILSFFTLLGIVMGAHGQPQHWNYVGDNYSPTEHVVYLSLSDSDGNPVTLNANGDWIGAFIDGECRGAAQAKTKAVTNSINIYYFPLRIKGTADDNGKTVSFRYFRQQAGSNYYTEYEVNPVTALTYENEATKGTLSDLFWLTFNQPLYFSFPENLSVKVGESLNLMDQFKWTPENATRPINIEWDFSNASPYINVENDVFTGLAPAEYPVYLGFNSLGNIKAEDDRHYAYVTVIQPLTDLKLKDEYLKGYTVYKYDSITLTRVLQNCYIKTPLDANEKLVWTCSDPTAVTYHVDANNGEHYAPMKAGNYTLTLQGEKLSVTMPLTIMNQLEGIEPVIGEIHLFAGDNLTDLLPHAVSFIPSEFVNKELQYGPVDTTYLKQQPDGSIIAKNNIGQTSIDIVSKENNSYMATISVYIHPNVTGVTVNKSVLSYLYTEQGRDITDDVMGNFKFSPDATYRPSWTEYSTSERSVVNFNDAPTFTALQKGTATISVSHSANRTTLSADNALVTNTVDVKGQFTVNVLQGLTNFTFDTNEVKMSRNGTYTLAFKPEPADVTYDAAQISVEIGGDLFTLATAQKNDEGALSWTITPKAVGYGTINVCYGGTPLARLPLFIGQNFTQKEGWAWVTPYGGNVDTLNVIYGDALQEMRSQTQVMYNDPQYGYFGELHNMTPTQGYKVRIKDGQSVDTFNGNVGYTYDNFYITLGDQWNWIGFGYQFDHTIAEALMKAGNEFTIGDRIVSKDNFTEFNGTDWEGTLTMLTAGDAYMFYNASGSERTLYTVSESELGQPSDNPSGAKANVQRSGVWTFNGTRYADNMTIVADLGSDYASDRYSVGAFVGNECRGEGRYVDGKWFITVHGDAAATGQQVTFRVYDTMTGTTVDVDGKHPFTAMAGTLRAPVRLTVGSTTGISTIQTDGIPASARLFTLDGKAVTGKPAPGMYIVKEGNNVRKVMIK